MKYFFLLSLLTTSFAWSDSTVNFHRTLNKDLETEIKQDDFKYKKKSHRAPASVTEVEKIRPLVQETPKIDKNVRQIGPHKW